MAKLSFLEIVGVALFTNVILWQATSSYSLGPYSSTVTEETLTTTTGSNSCDGIPCTTYKHCVVNTTDNSPQCVCLEVCTRIYAPVCGSDGRSYDNDCLLGVEACTTNIEITVLRQGRCDDATPSTGPGPYPTPIAMEPTTAGGGGGTPSGIPVQYTTTTTTTQETMTTTGTGSNGCESMTCPVGEHCDLNSDNRPACFCNDVCYLLYAPVCGSDGQTYSNDCFLGMEACRTNTTITILYRSGCGDAPPTFPSTYTTPPTEESTTTTGTGTPSGIPVQYTTTEETTTTTGSTCNGTTCPPGKPCPRFCPAIYDPVCGSDGKTYSSVCSLQVQACTTSTSITVQHNGSCDDGCTGFECLFYGQCSSDAYNRPTCVCLLGCNKMYLPVCGSNSQTYPNECELQRDSCQTQISITVSHTGSCDGGSNDCDNGTCPLSIIPVCGSDNQTYAGECELRKVACQTNTNITVLHPGKCDEVTVTASTPASRRTKNPRCRKNKKDRRHRKDGL